MNAQIQSESDRDSHRTLMQMLARLAREASIEIAARDVGHVSDGRGLLAPGKKIYVNHLPGQTWSQTEAACAAIGEAGYAPVPHLPVRLLTDAATLERTVDGFVSRAHVREVLLIAGDYPEPIGPYATVSDVMRSGLLKRNGLSAVSIAGHPEGHPKVALEEIRRAERDKALLAVELGLEVTLLSQFFFDSRPFLQWVAELRANGIATRVVAGLAGPVRLATLLKLAVRCGVGSSVRALVARPSSFVKLVGSYGPEVVMRGLAQALSAGETDFSGIHLFCFGGFLNTCQWLHAVAEGRFELNESGGFDV
jgi:methylenetetrahydrofolate reductase (NADPH)